MVTKLVEKRCLVFRGGCAGSTRLSGASLDCYTRGGYRTNSRRYGVVVRCERPGDSSEQGKTDSVESLFAKELKKRSINSPNDIQEPSEGQLERSRDLQTEGLEGLPERGKQLLTLGSTFFLSFLPLGAVVAVIFATLAFGFGDSFVHQGGVGPPPYVDPNELLAPENFEKNSPGEPFVRFRRNYTDYSDSYGPEESEEEAAGNAAAAAEQQEHVTAAPPSE